MNAPYAAMSQAYNSRESSKTAAGMTGIGPEFTGCDNVTVAVGDTDTAVADQAQTGLIITPLNDEE